MPYNDYLMYVWLCITIICFFFVEMQFMGQYIRIAVATASDSGSETQKGSGDYASEVLRRSLNFFLSNLYYFFFKLAIWFTKLQTILLIFT